MGHEFADWKSTFLFVIPAQAGILGFLGFAAQTNMDASLRRQDELVA